MTSSTNRPVGVVDEQRARGIMHEGIQRASVVELKAVGCAVEPSLEDPRILALLSRDGGIPGVVELLGRFADASDTVTER